MEAFIVNIVNILGGYDSLGFGIVILGSYVVGSVVVGFIWWLFPIPLFGAVLLFEYFLEYVDKMPLTTSSIVSLTPLLAIVLSSATIYCIATTAYYRKHKVVHE